jgi:23S rRNA G2445 N2-methylase RlmL
MSRVKPRAARLAAALAAVVLACAAARAQVTPIAPPTTQTPEQQEPVKKDVPYVPTPEAVVEEMLKLAGVSKDDVVYDLGCGDGRIVVTAAQKYGARGVGIDIDPQRIAESNANAQKAGVTSRVEFKVQDLFEADLREATVVTLYLLPSINLKLRPMLFEQLKPGTRVVSHAFDMGDWKPDKTTTVDGRPVYFWVIPEKSKQPAGSQTSSQ